MIYIVRVAEIGLKGKNRGMFENTLVGNIKFPLQRKGIEADVRRYQGRIIIECAEDISDFLKNVFGIANFSIAHETEIEKVKEKILELIKGKKFETFRVTVQRLNKNFGKTSQDFAGELGACVVELGKKVDLKNFDLNIQVEIMDKAYVFFEKVKGFGGMPVGVEGKAVCLLEDEKSIAACWLAMKRGCAIIPVSYSDFDLSGLQMFSPHELALVKIKNLEETEKMAKAIVVNDTIDNVNDYDTKLLILRPLIYYDEDEIKETIKLCKRK